MKCGALGGAITQRRQKEAHRGGALLGRGDGVGAEGGGDGSDPEGGGDGSGPEGGGDGEGVARRRHSQRDAARRMDWIRGDDRVPIIPLHLLFS